MLIQKHALRLLCAFSLAACARCVSAAILPVGATPTKLATGFIFTESPLYDGAGGVYFSDLNSNHVNSHIEHYSLTTGLTAVADSLSGGANGTIYNANHQMVTADRDRRQLSLRSTSDISVVQQVLANSWNGTPFNGPNDLVIDGSGGIYFTDPDYENRRSLPDAVYYLNPQGAVSRILTGFNRPNGVILSPDGHTLYLAVEAEKRIMAYDVTSGGVLANGRQFARTDVTAGGATIPNITNGPDGLTVDGEGNVYSAVQNAVWAWNPSGQQLFQLAFPEDPTNLDFGGVHGNTLFVAAGKSLYSVDLNLAPEPGTLGVLGCGAVVLMRCAKRARSFT